MKKIGLEKGPVTAFAKTFRRSLIMRVNIVFALIILFGLQVQAKTGYGQEKITLHETNVSLVKALEDVRKQTGMSYGGLVENLYAGQPVSISVKNAMLVEVLDLLFKGQPFKYEIVGKIIVVEKKDEAASKIGPGDGKPVHVQGSVYNETGQPLAGANVTIKETEKGIVTNARGEFDLGAVPMNSTIIVSFIGFTPQRLVVKDAINLKIYLKVATNELDKVVIQAYGTTTDRLNTGNIATVTAEQIERQPNLNPILSLQGEVPGLDIVQQSGYAGAPVKVELRGRSAIGSFPSDPLYIVDGVPLTVNEVGGTSSYPYSSGFLQNGMNNPANGQSPLFSINPDDIESMTVLKDADATSIYGSRGANGVILITTKKGKAGKTKLDIKVEQGDSKITRFWQMLNTPEYLSVRREAFKNDGITPTTGNAYDLLVWDTTRTTDWQHELQGGIGKYSNAQVSLTGGDARTTFRASGGYKRITYITTTGGSDQKGAMSFNINHRSASDLFNVSMTTQFTVEESDLVQLPGSITMEPDAPGIYDSVGKLNYAGWAPEGNSYPFGALKRSYTSNTNFINSNVVASFQPAKGLKLQANVGANEVFVKQQNLIPIASQNPADNPTGSAQFGYNQNKNWIVEPQVSYDAFISKGKLSAVAGTSYQDNTTDGQYTVGFGYSSDALLRTISNATSISGSDNSGEYKYAAIFGRVNYNWEDKYIINFSARRDGSSKFGQDHEFGNFAAGGAAWIFTEERWVRDHIKLLSFGKLRGSYGTTGSDNVQPYAYLSRWSSNGTQPYEGISPLEPTQHANPNYQWQVNKKLETALELGFLKDRITTSVAYYRDRCGNQLIQFTLPQFTGFNSVVGNLPAVVQNSGWEVKVSAKVLQSKNFNLTVGGNIAFNANKLVAYPGLAQSPYAGVYAIGQPLNSVLLFHYLGVDPLTGQYRFADRNHDGVISNNIGATDDEFYHNLNPKYFGGIFTNLSYRHLQLYVLFFFKNQIGQNAISQGHAPGGTTNQPVGILGKEWRYPGDIASVARFTTRPQQSDQNFLNSDAGYTNASYIRCRNLQLSYTLSTTYIRKAGMQDASLFVRGENLFVITPYKGMDPEVQSFGGLQPAKILTGGISLTF